MDKHLKTYFGLEDDSYKLDQLVKNTRQPSEIEKAARELVKHSPKMVEVHGVVTTKLPCTFCGQNAHKDDCPWLRLERACEEGK